MIRSYTFPPQAKFDKLFQEKSGGLLLDHGFTYIKKFRCYYRYISEDILQIYANRIYLGNSMWDAHIGVFPLCEPEEVRGKSGAEWQLFYHGSFPFQTTTLDWRPRAKTDRENFFTEEFSLSIDERIERCLDTLRQYALPRLDRVRTFADYMAFIREMPQYTARREIMAPLLGRYGTAEEIEAQIEQLKKEEAEAPSAQIKKWRAAEVEQYSRVKDQRLREGPESFDPLLRQYAREKRRCLDAEMAAPSQKGQTVRSSGKVPRALARFVPAKWIRPVLSIKNPIQEGGNMGTFGGYFGILSDGLTKEQLRERLGRLPPEDDAAFIWKEGARWLPYGDDTLGDTVSPDPQGALALSRKLDAPALVFSLFDSDVLFLYYSDARAGISQQYARANSGLFREVLGVPPEEMTGGPREDLPEFLLPYLDGKKLQKLWKREDYVFADERLADLCGLLGSAPLDDPDNLPEGFEALRP